MKTTELREYWHNLTQKELAEIFQIPQRTVENWDHRGSCPQYVINLMSSFFGNIESILAHGDIDYYISHDGFVRACKYSYDARVLCEKEYRRKDGGRRDEDDVI